MGNFRRSYKLIFVFLIAVLIAIVASLIVTSCVNKTANKASICIVSGPKRQRAPSDTGTEVWTASANGNNLKVVADLGKLEGDWNISRHSFISDGALPIFSGRSSKDRKTGLLDLKTGTVNEEVEEWGITLFPQRFFGDTDKVATQMIDEEKTPKEHYVALWNSEGKKFDRVSFPAIDETLGPGRFITGLGGWGDTLATLIKEEKHGIGGPGGRVSQWHLYIFDMVSKTRLAEFEFDFSTEKPDQVSLPHKPKNGAPAGDRAEDTTQAKPTEKPANDKDNTAAKPSDKPARPVDKPDDATARPEKPGAPASQDQLIAPPSEIGRFLVSIADFSFLRPPDSDGNIVIAYNSVLFDTTGEPDGTRLGGSKPVILKLNISTGKTEQIPIPEFVPVDPERPSNWVTRYSFYDSKTGTTYLQFRNGRGGSKSIHPIAALNSDLSWKLAAETTDRYAWFVTAADGSLWFTEIATLDEPKETPEKEGAKPEEAQARTPVQQNIGKAIYRVDPKTGEKRVIHKAPEIMALFVIN